MAGTERIRWRRDDRGGSKEGQERGTHVDMGCDVNGYRTRRDADSGKAEMQSTNARTNDASSSTTPYKGGEERRATTKAATRSDDRGEKGEEETGERRAIMEKRQTEYGR
jgi:hypothetical protein